MVLDLLVPFVTVGKNENAAGRHEQAGLVVRTDEFVRRQRSVSAAATFITGISLTLDAVRVSYSMQSTTRPFRPSWCSPSLE